MDPFEEGIPMNEYFRRLRRQRLPRHIANSRRRTIESQYVLCNYQICCSNCQFLINPGSVIDTFHYPFNRFLQSHRYFIKCPNCPEKMKLFHIPKTGKITLEGCTVTLAPYTAAFLALACLMASNVTGNEAAGVDPEVVRGSSSSSSFECDGSSD